MDTRNSKTTRKFWLAAVLAPLALFLAGCDVKLVDLTPTTLRANPSNAYTITAQVQVRNSAVVPGSVRPEIIIDGRAQPMTPVAGSESLYEYDYSLSGGRTSAAYYILVRYQRKTANATVSKEIYSGIKNINIEDRYTVELEVNRAPVGARVAILGRGFSRNDQVMVDGTAAQTQFESDNAISFTVPSVPPGRSYRVTVAGADRELFVGSLRIDSSSTGSAGSQASANVVRVSPDSLALRRGQRLPLLFSLPNEAPSGGMTIVVTTDIPDSVIMPEVVIPGGQRSTSIRIEGGAPGMGNLFVELEDGNEIVIPVTVTD